MCSRSNLTSGYFLDCPYFLRKEGNLNLSINWCTHAYLLKDFFSTTPIRYCKLYRFAYIYTLNLYSTTLKDVLVQLPLDNLHKRWELGLWPPIISCLPVFCLISPNNRWRRFTREDRDAAASKSKNLMCRISALCPCVVINQGILEHHSKRRGETIGVLLLVALLPSQLVRVQCVFG
jgi:hypothetical protein